MTIEGMEEGVPPPEARNRKASTTTTGGLGESIQRRRSSTTEQWPDLGSRAVKIGTKDYVKLFGMWRGSLNDEQDPMFKFVQSENLLRMTVKRELRDFKKPRSAVPVR